MSPNWTLETHKDRTEHRLAGTTFLVVEPGQRSAKTLKLPKWAKFALLEATEEGNAPRGFFTSLKDAKAQALLFAGITAPIAPNRKQQRAIDSWLKAGYGVQTVKQCHRSLLVELERTVMAEFPEACPYANLQYETHELTVALDVDGYQTVVKKYQERVFWHCDIPQEQPRSFSMTIPETATISAQTSLSLF